MFPLPGFSFLFRSGVSSSMSSNHIIRATKDLESMHVANMTLVLFKELLRPLNRVHYIFSIRRRRKCVDNSRREHLSIGLKINADCSSINSIVFEK